MGGESPQRLCFAAAIWSSDSGGTLGSACDAHRVQRARRKDSVCV